MVALGAALAQYACAATPSPLLRQYGHTSWTGGDGLPFVADFAIAQTPDGYIWLGGEFGLFRFDGVRAVQWQPPAGQQLPHNPYALLATPDDTLWIGTLSGLVSWDGTRLTQYPEIGTRFITSLYLDHEGTVWAGVDYSTLGVLGGRLCAIRSGRTQCYGDDGRFGTFVWSIGEDNSGTLWVGAETGLWRWKPGPPKQYAMPGTRANGLSKTEDGRILIGIRAAGLSQVAGDRIVPYPVPGVTNPNLPLPDRDIDANKLLRDLNGGLWIGSHEHGLIHVHQGRTEIITTSDGLSGDITCSLFEDREGNVWFGSSRGLVRFRELPVTTAVSEYGQYQNTVVAAPDGDIWIGMERGLIRWRNGQIATFSKADGLPDDVVQSLFIDSTGQLWASFRGHGLSYLKDGRFVRVPGVPSDEVYYIVGDGEDGLWLSGNKGLARIRGGHLLENHPWASMGHDEEAKIIVPDRGGVWLAFWIKGGLAYFKDGQVRALYNSNNRLAAGGVVDIRLDRDGALWAVVQGAGLTRIKDGRVAMLTTRNGLPCDRVHWSMEANDGSMWLHTACGLVRIARNEVEAWIADSNRKVQAQVWDSADGVTLRYPPQINHIPTVAKSADGKLWFITGEGVQVLDPQHLLENKLPPPVHIEKVVADHKVLWQNMPGFAGANLRLPPRTRDLQIDYTALSLVAPEKVHFRFRLEGQDSDWREVVNNRQAEYTNLAPGHYRFRVTASNNSGVWNEQGASLDFYVAPAWWQTNWFRALCVAALLALLWGLYRIRIGQLQEQEKKFRQAVQSMPANAFIADPDGNRSFVNKGWLEYTGLNADQGLGTGWHAAVHPDDLGRVLERWRISMATGHPLEYEARFRRGSDGAYRWFWTRAVPVRDERGKIIKWCGVATDIEDRKRVEELQAELAHVNRVSTLGELAASISHELKQPIAATLLSASTGLSWLRRDPPDIGKASTGLERIVKNSERATEIIDRLRSLYKKALPKREPVPVNEVIGEMVVLLRGEANKNAVSIRTNLNAELPIVMADRVQLQQVLMNLMLNGIEAMKDTGGTLTVSSQPDKDGQVLISVSDTGPGLPPGKAEHIFDAFFTTKPQGSGMGLAISRSIVESHGGHIWASASDGGGASFHFTLPVAAEATQAVAARTQAEAF